MGQYYMVYLEQKNKETVFNRDVDGVYTMAKLMEHSWWENPFVNTICQKIFKKPGKIAWVGDYANDESAGDNIELYNKVWGEGVKTRGVSESQVSLHGKFLVNHTTKEYLNCSNYYERNEDHGWCVHPLPLLTALGNGRGGGDYSGINEDFVGIWALSEISIELKVPDGYTEMSIDFKE